MAVPLKIQTFDAFLGTHEAMGSTILPDIFSSSGSQDVFIDRFARVASRKGFTAITTHTTSAGSTAVTRQLIPYSKNDAGTIVRKHLFVLDDGIDEWEIRLTTDTFGTSSVLEDLGAVNVGQNADWARLEDNLFITSGKSAPRKYDGSTIGTVGLTQSPTPTATENAAAGTLNGNYRYKIVAILTSNQRRYGSTASSFVMVSDKKIDVTWTALGAGTANGYEIYRTTGVGTTFYHLTTVDGGTSASYQDNIADSVLVSKRVLDEHGDAPPTCYNCEVHQSRMWWLRTDANPTRAYWSDPGEPESVGTNNYLDFDDNTSQGDTITGALGDYTVIDSSGNRNAALVVFTEGAVWNVTGTGAVVDGIPNWEKARTNAQIGAASNRSIIRIPAGAKFTDAHGAVQGTTVATIAYFTPHGDIRLFDGDSDVIISHPMRSTLLDFNYSARHKIHAINDEEGSQIIWFIPIDSNNDASIAAVWNYRYGVWYKWTNMDMASALVTDTATEAQVIYSGMRTSGTILNLLDSNCDANFPVRGIWMSKTLYGQDEQGKPAFSDTKRWRWIDLMFRVDTDIDINVELLDGTTSDSGPSIYSFTVTPDYSRICTGNYSFGILITSDPIVTADGDFIVCAQDQVQFKQPFNFGGLSNYYHSTGIRLKVETTANFGNVVPDPTQQGGWALEAFNLAYQILPGQKRRFQD